MVSGILLLEPARVRHVELDPEDQVDRARALHAHLFAHRFDRVEPARDVGGGAGGQGRPALAEHQAEVLTLRQL